MDIALLAGPSAIVLADGLARACGAISRMFSLECRCPADALDHIINCPHHRVRCVCPTDAAAPASNCYAHL